MRRGPGGGGNRPRRRRLRRRRLHSFLGHFEAPDVGDPAVRPRRMHGHAAPARRRPGDGPAARCHRHLPPGDRHPDVPGHEGEANRDQRSTGRGRRLRRGVERRAAARVPAPRGHHERHGPGRRRDRRSRRPGEDECSDQRDHAETVSRRRPSHDEACVARPRSAARCRVLGRTRSHRYGHSLRPCIALADRTRATKPHRVTASPEEGLCAPKKKSPLFGKT